METRRLPCLWVNTNLAIKAVGFMRRLIPVFASVSGVVLLSVCVYALNKTNTPSTEKIKVVAASENHYAIARIA